MPNYSNIEDVTIFEQGDSRTFCLGSDSSLAYLNFNGETINYQKDTKGETMEHSLIGCKILDEQGNVKSFADATDARLYYLDIEGKKRKYLLEGENGFNLYKVVEYEEVEAGLRFKSVTFSNTIVKRNDWETDETTEEAHPEADITLINKNKDAKKFSDTEWINEEHNVGIWLDDWDDWLVWGTNIVSIDEFEPYIYEQDFNQNSTSLHWNDNYTGEYYMTQDCVVETEEVEAVFKLKVQKVASIDENGQFIFDEEILDFVGYDKVPVEGSVYVGVNERLIGNSIKKILNLSPWFQFKADGSLSATLNDEAYDGINIINRYGEEIDTFEFQTSTINNKNVTTLYKHQDDTIVTNIDLEDLGNEFTVMGYFYRTSDERPAFFAGNYDYHFGVDGNGDTFDMWAGNSYDWGIIESDSHDGRSDVEVDLNTWYHVAYSYSLSARKYTLFINGVKVKELSGGNFERRKLEHSENAYLIFGRWGSEDYPNSGHGFGLGGNFYDMRIYKEALDADSIKEVMSDI